MRNISQQFDILLEAALDDVAKARIDTILRELPKYRDADFGLLPGGHNAGTHYIGKMSDILSNIRHYGKTAEDIAKQQEQAKQFEQQSKDTKAANTAIMQKYAIIQQKYPKFLKCYEDSIAFTQPNGRVNELHVSSVPQNLAIWPALFKLPQYDELVRTAQELRDFGFNFGAGLINTSSAKFRTKYSLISDVVFNYQGPMLVPFAGYTEFFNGQGRYASQYVAEVRNMTVPGEATVKVATYDMTADHDQYLVQTIKLTNVTLDHIGEIIDTIDIISHATHGTARIKDIQLMGTQVVEYVIIVKTQYGYGTTNSKFSVPSSKISSMQETTKLIYDEVRRLRSLHMGVMNNG